MEVSASIKTGNTESMNSPVNKTRLIDFYNELRLVKWPYIRDHLKTCAEPESVTAKIQVQLSLMR